MSTKSHHFSVFDDEEATQNFLYVLILSANALTAENRPAILERIDRLTTLVSLPVPLVAFLLQSGQGTETGDIGINAYMELQVLWVYYHANLAE